MPIHPLTRDEAATGEATGDAAVCADCGLPMANCDCHPEGEADPGYAEAEGGAWGGRMEPTVEGTPSLPATGLRSG